MRQSQLKTIHFTHLRNKNYIVVGISGIVIGMLFMSIGSWIEGHIGWMFTIGLVFWFTMGFPWLLGGYIEGDRCICPQCEGIMNPRNVNLSTNLYIHQRSYITCTKCHYEILVEDWRPP